MTTFSDNFNSTTSGWTPSYLERTLGSGWSIDSFLEILGTSSTASNTAVTYTGYSYASLATGTEITVSFASTTSPSLGVVYLEINGQEGTSQTPPAQGTFTLTAPMPSNNIINTISIYFTDPSGIVLGKFTSNLLLSMTCIIPQSKIKTLSGYKEIQDIIPGEILPQGKVARIIESPLGEEDKLEITRIKQSSLDENLPLEDILCCSNHIFIYKGKRILAKELGESKVTSMKDSFLPAKDGKYKLLDIQFDFEGSYTVFGLESQSRSPYCKISPLPKELYFNQNNYKPLLVDNTLREDPPFNKTY